VLFAISVAIAIVDDVVHAHEVRSFDRATRIRATDRQSVGQRSWRKLLYGLTKQKWRVLLPIQDIQILKWTWEEKLFWEHTLKDVGGIERYYCIRIVWNNINIVQ
jgi:hypothetical protein